MHIVTGQQGKHMLAVFIIFPNDLVEKEIFWFKLSWVQSLVTLFNGFVK